jgi:hypothetical protein
MLFGIGVPIIKYSGAKLSLFFETAKLFPHFLKKKISPPLHSLAKKDLNIFSKNEEFSRIRRRFTAWRKGS